MAELDSDAIAFGIERGTRRAYAAAVRHQAAQMRALAQFVEAQAIGAEEHAAAVLAGEEPVPERPLRLMVVEEGVEVRRPDEEPEGEPVVELMGVAGDGGWSELSEPMREFVELFSSRYQRSAFFVQEVNRAADAGMAANESTARRIAGAIQEREEGR